MSETPAFLTYGGWRKPRSAGVWGATFGTTMVVLAAFVFWFLAGLIFGFLVTVAGGLLSAIVIAPLLVVHDGRSGYERLLMRWQFWRASRRGEHVYSSGPFSRIPGGRYRLPGVLADTELVEGVDDQNRRFGMIHMPDKHLSTIVLEAFPQGAEAFDQATIDNAVGQWARLLSAAGSDGDIAALVAVVETLPETGIELYETVAANVRVDAPQLARDSMYELATGLISGGVRLTARIAVTFVAQTEERRADPLEQAVEIGRRLGGLTGMAARAGVPCTPMPAEDIAAFVRRSYEPGALGDIETGLYSEAGTGVAWADAGPRTQIEERDRLLHDGAVSVTWEMREAPKDAVTEDVLYQLLQPDSRLPIKRVALIYRPHSAGDAAELVDKDYKDALTARSSARGIASAQAELDVASTEQARIEKARGHGLTRFGILITVTQPHEDADVPRVDEIVRDLSKQCSLAVRRSFCWQAPAFAASLGVGVIPPEHSTIPKFLAG
ncbi:SCO6880 family protein [Hoyosella subflava]|uniref:Putative integral membrane protein n=1 Tax=Hoyosella subflava (strain DSM 45089 / JCM 17490 / NBRC 109087 / DQS3-9A1) TaxID=443218 RepID=F6ESI6_HOYSD|nr:SCO6880 family protein [Hoyosella subflava]AEF43107.1 Putative integral membrane protein [Hoyosella subflava DQS3-9A1]